MTETENVQIKELEASAGCVIVHFEIGDADSVNIYRWADGDTDWSYVANDTHSPYHDYWPVKHLGNLEDREYKICPVKDGVEGPKSEAVGILFAG